MAEAPQDEDDTMTPGYKPPAPKSIAEIKNQDADDESLRRYKEMLLGNLDSMPASDDPRNVVVKSLSLVVEGRDDVKLDLTGDLKKLKDVPFILKEGSKYKLKVMFLVNHEIVTGLSFVTTIQRAVISTSFEYMLGSYAPKREEQAFTTTEEEAPKGMIGRGKYKAKSSFRDDDGNPHLQWEWTLEIHKDWHDGKEA